MANVMVTGGAGFIGSNLTERLVALGHSVRVFDNLSSGHRENLAPVVDQIDFFEGDIRHPEECLRATKDMEVVFHQAAMPSVPRSVEQPLESHETNITGTLNVLMAAKAQGCRRVVYAASSSAYGDTEVTPKHEDLTPLPMSPYAVQKLAAEHYFKVFYDCYGLQTVSLRYFNVFGPRQDPNSQYAAVIAAFATAALTGRVALVYGDGEQTRDFTYIDNVLDANIAAMDAPETRGEVVNIACGGGISVNEVLRCLERILNCRIEVRHEPMRAGDVLHSTADITQARKLFGYSPKVDFETGLRRAIEAYRVESAG
ncbi:MAG: SDR family oxidoreductase [Planctomycetes bacterium]|nr:SDR family oxidoreductase [Planctomycetota bacterium]